MQLLLAAVLLLAQVPLDQILGEGRASSGSARRDLERFNQAFDRDFAAAWNARPPAERRALLSRTFAFLGGIRGLGLRDSSSRLYLAHAYRRVARFQEDSSVGTVLGSGWTMGPLYGYQNSALILTQLANENPNDPNVRGELVLDIGRIQALGGSMPILMSVPVGGHAAREERGIPVSYSKPENKSLPTLPGVPVLDLAAVTDREAASNAMARYTAVLAIAVETLEVLRPLQESVTAMGFSLHPDTMRALTRMSAHLDKAKKEIESRHFAESLESLGIAEGEAHKALKVVGR